MQSRFCALGVLLASLVSPAAAKCTETTASAQKVVEAGGEAKADGDPTNSAPVKENWELATTLEGHKNIVTSLAFSPNGSRLYSASLDGEIKLWDTKTRKELASMQAHPGFVKAVAVSASGKVLYSAGGFPGEVKIWDAGALEQRLALPYSGPPYCLALSRDSALVAAAGEYEVSIWSVRDGKRLRSLAVGMWPITGLAFSPEGSVLFVGGVPDQGPGKPSAGRGIVRIWDTATGAKLDEIELPQPVDGMDLSKDGRVLAVAAVALRVFDVATDKGRVELSQRFSALEQKIRSGVPVYQEQFRQVAISPDGAMVAGAAGTPGSLAAEAGHLDLFARSDGRRIARLQTPRPLNGHVQLGAYDVNAVAFSLDGTQIASGGNTRSVALWVARPAAQRRVGVASGP